MIFVLTLLTPPLPLKLHLLRLSASSLGCPIGSLILKGERNMSKPLLYVSMQFRFCVRWLLHFITLRNIGSTILLLRLVWYVMSVNPLIKPSTSRIIPDFCFSQSILTKRKAKKKGKVREFYASNATVSFRGGGIHWRKNTTGQRYWSSLPG